MLINFYPQKILSHFCHPNHQTVYTHRALRLQPATIESTLFLRGYISLVLLLFLLLFEKAMTRKMMIRARAKTHTHTNGTFFISTFIVSFYLPCVTNSFTSSTEIERQTWEIFSVVSTQSLNIISEFLLSSDCWKSF